MTAVSIFLKQPAPNGVDVPVPNGGLTCKPTKRRDLEGYIVLPVPFYIHIRDGVPVEKITTNGVVTWVPFVPDFAATVAGDWAWDIVERVPNGRSWLAGVPASGPVDYDDLVVIDKDTLNPAEPVAPVWEGLVDAKVAAEAALARNADNLTSGTVADARIASTIARDAEVTAAILAQSVVDDGKYGRRNAKVLYPESYGAVGDGTTDDTAAINAMVTAANALVTAGAGHVVMQFDSKEYLLAAAPIHPDGAGGAYAQIPLPKRANTANRAILEFRGVATAPLVAGMSQAAVQKFGTILRSTATGGLDATYGLASVIGGNAYLSTGATPTNLCVILDGITLRRPDNPSIAGADFTNCNQAKTNNVSFDTNVPTSSITYPTYPTNIGLLMPDVNNYALSSSEGDTYIQGSYCAVRFSEHYTLNHLVAYKNVLSFGVSFGYHGSVITHANLEYQTNVIGRIDPAVGVVSPGSKSYTTIAMLDIEDAASGPFVAGTHIVDASDMIVLEASYVRVLAGVGTVTGALTRTGTGAQHRLTDLVTPAVSGAWTGYTPALISTGAQPNLGTGATATGKYTKTGRTVTGWAAITLGTGATPGVGIYSVSLPLTPAAGQIGVAGSFYIVDWSANQVWAGVCKVSASNVVFFLAAAAAAAYEVGAAQPFAFAATDQIRFEFTYESAS